MRKMAGLPLILVFLVLIPVGAAGATGSEADTVSISGLLVSTILANLSIAFTVVLLCIFGLYAYASLARFAPYHSWIYLYLVSLSGIVWAAFLLTNGGSMTDVVFVLTTVAGINLIVHVLRFDRIPITGPSPAKSAALEQSTQATDPLLLWKPPRF